MKWNLSTRAWALNLLMSLQKVCMISVMRRDSNTSFFGSILDHKTDGHALSVADQYVVVRGQSSKQKTTKGWHLCVQWKDGTTSWERLSDLKESHPIQVAEYSLAQGIIHEPDFNWWVTHVLKKREAIISALKRTPSRVVKKNIKFGIWVPQSVDEVLRIDKKKRIICWDMGLQRISMQLWLH